jgi:hypothetical protein
MDSISNVALWRGRLNAKPLGGFQPQPIPAHLVHWCRWQQVCSCQQRNESRRIERPWCSVIWSTLVALKPLPKARRARCGLASAVPPSAGAHSCGGQCSEREGDPDCFRPTFVAADAAARRQDRGNFDREKHSNVISFQKCGAAELCRWATPLLHQVHSFIFLPIHHLPKCLKSCIFFVSTCSEVCS